MERAIVRLDGRNLAMAAHLLTPAEGAALRKSPHTGGLAAVEDGVCAGAALFTVREGLVRLRTLAVSPSRRRTGVGSDLVRALRALARRSGQTLTVPFAAVGPEDGMYRLLSRLRLALARGEGFEARVERGQIADFCRRHEALCARPAQPLSALRPGALRALAGRLERDWPGQAEALRLAPGQFSPDLSRCKVKNGAVQAVCLMGEEGATAHLRFLYGAPGCGGRAMEALAASLAQAARRPDLTRLTMTVTTPQAGAILEKLCGDYEITRRLYTAYDLG